MPPPDDQAQVEGDLQNAMDGVLRQLTDIDGAAGKLVDAINSALRTATFISPPAAWYFSRKASAQLEQLFAAITELKQACTEFVQAGVPIFSLIRVGFGWNSAILPSLSGMAGTARDIRPNALHAWEGQAADAYLEKRWGQRDALVGTTGIVKDLSQWCVDVAALNAKFLVDITTPLIDLAEAIIEIAVELATVIGVLEAIGSAADAVASAATSVLTIAQEAARHTLESVSKLAEAKNILNNNDVFPAGGWPQSVLR
jgi:hypothetical protein